MTIVSVTVWGVYLLWAALFCSSCEQDYEAASTGRQARLRHPDNTFTQEESRYWARVQDFAAQLGTDGCTKTLNIHVRCCDLHDVLYVLRFDPFDPNHPKISKAQADRRFLDCMRRHSWLGFWSPIAYLRYFFVKYFGNKGKEWLQ